MYVLRWADSVWVAVDHLGNGTKGVDPVPSTDGIAHLVWVGLEEIFTYRPESYLVTSELQGSSLTTPDTITTVSSSVLSASAAASPARRWATVGDFGDLRLLYSEQYGPWIEVPVAGRGDRGTAVVSLNDMNRTGFSGELVG
jgi:hypothetical protein